MKLQEIFPAFNHLAQHDRPPSRAPLRVLGGDTSHLAEADSLDLAIDGADDVLPGSLTLIKGLGGALLRERIVAAAARRFIVIVDGSKVDDRFSSRAPVPMEVVPFGHKLVRAALAGSVCARSSGWTETVRPSPPTAATCSMTATTWRQERTLTRWPTMSAGSSA